MPPPPIIDNITSFAFDPDPAHAQAPAYHHHQSYGFPPPLLPDHTEKPEDEEMPDVNDDDGKEKEEEEKDETRMRQDVEVRERAAGILGSWEQLSWHSRVYGESIPQTRLRLQKILIYGLRSLDDTSTSTRHGVGGGDMVEWEDEGEEGPRGKDRERERERERQRVRQKMTGAEGRKRGGVGGGGNG